MKTSSFVIASADAGREGRAPRQAGRSEKERSCDTARQALIQARSLGCGPYPRGLNAFDVEVVWLRQRLSTVAGPRHVRR